jgi:hypothetical protein
LPPSRRRREEVDVRALALILARFDRLLGPSPALHGKIAEWWKRKPQ